MNVNKIIQGYKLRSKTRVANAVDQIIYGIARAYKVAESEGEAGYRAGKHVLKAFCPTVNQNKLRSNQNGDAYFTLNRLLKTLAKKVPEYWRNELDNEDVEQVQEMAGRLRDLTTRHYLYIFVRQDMVPEQQAVQAAHATFVAGAAIRADFAGNAQRAKTFDPASTHFVLLGVRNLNALEEAKQLAEDAGINTHAFYEEDIGNEMTAFTTGIVTQENRHVFAGYDLLKFGDANVETN
jgi:hypothetical protein